MKRTDVGRHRVGNELYLSKLPPVDANVDFFPLFLLSHF